MIETALTAAMLRVESEHSVAGSDEHIMDGGITIKERKDVARGTVRHSTSACKMRADRLSAQLCFIAGFRRTESALRQLRLPDQTNPPH